MKTHHFPGRLPILASALWLPLAAAEVALAQSDAARPFIRGDADGDGRADLSDALAIVRSIASGGGKPACLEALDVDDDGAIAVTDAVRLLLHLFRGGAAPPPPYPACGVDPTPDGLGCAAAAGCAPPAPHPGPLPPGTGSDSGAAGQFDRVEAASAGALAAAKGERPATLRLTGASSRRLPLARGAASGGPAPSGGSVPASIALGEVVAGEIKAATQIDTYTFSAGHGQWIVGDAISSVDVTVLHWSIADAHGRVMAEQESRFGDLGPVELLAGDYTVTLWPAGTTVGAYSFRIADATPATIPAAIGASVDGASDPDHPGRWIYHELIVPAGGAQLFLTRLSGGLGVPTWELEDPLGQTAVTARNLASDGPFSLAGSLAGGLAGGAYRMKVLSPVSSYNFGSYSYTIRWTALPAASSTAISLGQTVSGEISAPGEVDGYTFSAPAGQSLYFDALATSNGSGIVWILRDGAGRAVRSSSGTFSDDGPLPLAGGEYRLEVFGEGVATGTYQFILSDATPTAPVAIALGQQISGEIPAGHPGTAQIYTFTADPLRRVALELLQSSNSGALDWLLEDSVGRVILPRTVSLATVSGIDLAGAAYRLSILGEGASTGSYTFRVRDDGLGTFAPAGAAATLGDEITGSITVPGGSQSYLFSAADGDRVYLDLLEASVDLDWSLLDPAGRLIATVQASSTDFSDLGPYPLAAGTYSVSLKARTATAAPAYHFLLSPAPAELREANPGETISGDFAGEAGGVHRYRLALAQNQRVFFHLPGTAARLEWRLRDPAGREVFPLSKAGSFYDDQGPFDLAAGDYELEFDPDFGYQPAYQAQILLVDDRASDIAVGQIVAGSLAGRGGSTESYRFMGKAGQRLLFSKSGASPWLYWSLLDPLGGVVFGPESIDGATDTHGPLELLFDGTYMLRFDPMYGFEPEWQFQILPVVDSDSPLPWGSPVSGSLGIGATASYHFDAVEGQRVYFDLTAGNSALTWSLFDEFGQGLFTGARASLATDDQGPLSLAAGSYRLVLDASGLSGPSYAFTASILEADLAVEDLDASPRFVFQGDARREVAVTYHARNLGGGPAPAPKAVDRIIYSADAALGNQDDVVLGEYLRFEPLAPGADYGRTVTVSLPASAPVGSHRLFLLLDAQGAIAEPGGEGNNTASIEVQVGQDLPPAQPGFISTTSFPVEFTAATGKLVYDVPLAQSVQLDSIRHVLVDGVTLDLIHPGVGQGAGTAITLSLLSGSSEVLEVATHSLGIGNTKANIVFRFERRLEAQTVALLSTRQVDGLRFRFDQANNSASTIGSSRPDGRLEVDFAACEFHPCGPHQERRVDGVPPMTLSTQNPTDWSVVMFPESVPGDGLRLVSGPYFAADATGGFFGLGHVTSEAQLILDNGSLLTLDDWRSPSLLGPPPRTCASHALHLDGKTLDGRRVLGFQWRLRGDALSGTTVFTPLDPFAVRFLYDSESCRGAIPIPPAEVDPPDGSAFAPLSRVTLSGRALVPQAGRPLSAVLVNGVPVDALDGAGRFFHSVTIQPGENIFVVEVLEPGCGDSQWLVHLLGLPDGSSGLSGYSEVTADLAVEYTGSTFDRASGTFQVSARARNVSRRAVRGPLLLALMGLTPLSTRLASAAGTTDRGEPYALILAAGLLAPGEASPYVPLRFSDPDLKAPRYEVRWLAPSNRPPRFESAPPVRALADQVYRYQAEASDPDGDTVRYGLDQAPAGMAIDGATGLLTWSPAAADLGAQEIALWADDGAGGRAAQRFTLSVVSSSANRPPYFTTVPPAGAAVGASYRYAPGAIDPDGDATAFSLLEGPAGLALDAASGLVTWDFALAGVHRVSLRASDAQGAAALQSFDLTVGAVPSNPSAPRITASPSTEAVIGLLYFYAPAAVDPDGDTLSYELLAAPAGMSLDPSNGRLTWTPGASQTGPQAVSLVVRDGRGGETREDFTVVVSGAALNLPPVIESAPPACALVGAALSYTVAAIDPDGDAIAYSLVSGPSGMTLDGRTGLLEWTPGTGDAGQRAVALRASDGRGGAGSQSFVLLVRAANGAPQITSGDPPATVLAGRSWQYDLDATDADGDLLGHSILSGPAGLTIQPVTGLMSWSTGPRDVGTHAVTARVADGCGGSAQRSFSIEVLADTTPPAVDIGFPVNPAPVSGMVEVWLEASDLAGIASRSLTVECPAGSTPRELPLDNLSIARFSSSAVGYCTFTAAATDLSGNTATVKRTLTVGNPIDPLDPFPPVVELLQPAAGAVITAPVDLYATISDATAAGQPGSGPFSWTVEIAPLGSDAWETIGSGPGLPKAAKLARIDPTLKANGVYRLRILGIDGVQSGGIETTFSIAGEFKVGNYTTEFVDLMIPLAGLPILITRRYDSLDTTQGEFGAGWRLGLPGALTDSPAESKTGNSFVDLFASESMDPGARVYVTRPDGRRVGFTFKPQLASGLLTFIYAPAFEADPGVDDTLEVVDPPGNFTMIAGKANTLGVPYNPKVYRLKTKELVNYTIDEDLGLQRIDDPNGNSIEVRPEGLFSSLGMAVLFERDPQGRIQRIVEPESTPGGAAPHLDYAYDALGNLASFTNAVGATASYHYRNAAFPHFLTDIDDPLGQPLVRNLYDASGRLIALCGPGGDPTTLAGCTSLSWDPSSLISTVYDTRGYRTDLVHDAQGNLVFQRSYLDQGQTEDWTLEYDAQGNLLRTVDPAAQTWTSTFDDQRHETSYADPLGRTWRWTYSPCGGQETETDPQGNTSRSEFDGERCRAVATTTALGGQYRMSYDAWGELTETIDPVGNQWEFEYDTAGLQTRSVDPRARPTSYTHDAKGNLLSVTQPDGSRIDLEYDAANHPIRETVNTIPPRVTVYEYNAAGQLIHASDPDSDIRVSYFATGLPSSIESAGPSGAPSTRVDYEYDAAGNVTSVKDSLGGITTYAYDGANRLVSIRQSGAGVSPKAVEASYDLSSELLEIRRYADLDATVPVARTSFQVDCSGCAFSAKGIVHTRSTDGTSIEEITQQRSSNGVLLQMTDAEGTHSYRHDGLGRLLAVDHPGGGPQPNETYTYDAVGNRLTSHLGGNHRYSYADGTGGNELLADGKCDYQSDALGRISRRTERATGNSTEYHYDHRDHLVEVIERDAGGGERGRSSYTYDAFGRRIRSIENGQTSYLVYDSANPAVVLDDAGRTITRRLYGRGFDLALADEAGGVTRWFLTDIAGSVRDVVGNDGHLLVHFIYDSFGRIVNAPDAGAAAGIGFTGLEHSSATGLIHARARTYDPALGRFLQRDPQSPYQYDYVGNSPTRLDDHTGMASALSVFKLRMLDPAWPKGPNGMPLPRPPAAPGRDLSYWNHTPKTGPRPAEPEPYRAGRTTLEYALLVTFIILVAITALLAVAAAVTVIVVGIVTTIILAMMGGARP